MQEKRVLDEYLQRTRQTAFFFFYQYFNGEGGKTKQNVFYQYHVCDRRGCARVHVCILYYYYYYLYGFSCARVGQHPRPKSLLNDDRYTARDDAEPPGGEEGGCCLIARQKRSAREM